MFKFINNYVKVGTYFYWNNIVIRFLMVFYKTCIIPMSKISKH